MATNVFTRIIATELALRENGVENTLQLLDDGCTIPFISRYRKERTGALDEVKIGLISEWNDKLKALSKRKGTIISTIEEEGKMTAELKKSIDDCWDSTTLEDIYLPYKPKRRTKAQIAREQGLEPLANIVMMQRERDIKAVAQRYVRGEIKDVDSALQGAKDIIAETVSENAQTRQQMRNLFTRKAVIASKVVKDKADQETSAKYSDYFDLSEPLRKCSGNRLLAMLRGEKEGILKVKVSVDDDEAVRTLQYHYVHGNDTCSKLVTEAVQDAYKRLISPSIENETISTNKEKADEEAIGIFAENLRQLLLSAPLGQKRVMGIDPGFRTGCKVVCLDAQGNLLHHNAIFPHPPKMNRNEAAANVEHMVEQYSIEAIAIGNGTASRETNEFVRGLHFNHDVKIFVVSEDGASIYSASKIARDEFPEYDVTVRGAVSIGRRLMDPLAELVKIDPKSIGVGQYQYDVDQTKLKKSLDMTVESCVNSVGVNLNTASYHLLMYVSGLGLTLAKNIVDYRKENGAFVNRTQLKKVARLGPTAFEQCAGFLRIPEAKNPLDNTAVHPERYKLVEQMAHDCGCSVAELIKDKDKQKSIQLSKYVTDEVGMPTLNDIMKELNKPGLDPRDSIEEFEFDPNVKTVDDLIAGQVLPGIVTNITKFGAFVDIGVHQDGLVHISQMADKFVTDPTEVVHLHQHIKVRVIEIDTKRNRISLSMRIK